MPAPTSENRPHAERAAAGLAALEALPRLGFAATPTAVTELAALAAPLGLPWLGVKRDDLCTPLGGGSKVRKLDYVLATPRYADAARWATVGAIGSGHLVATGQAALLLQREVVFEIFDEPLSADVLQNLAFSASGPPWAAPGERRYHRSRVAMALRAPGVLLADTHRGGAVLPPGATTPRAMLGLVRGGLELAAQVAAGLLPTPSHVYVAIGSGGTAVGLAHGLALGGLGATVVVAVRAVEAVFMGRGRLRALQRGLAGELAALGLKDAAAVTPCAIVLDGSAIGRGYGWPTPQALAAVEALRSHNVAAESVYTGKAMAALLRDAATAQVQGRDLGPCLLWTTVRADTPLPHDPNYIDLLPPWLKHKITSQSKHKPDAQMHHTSRRRLLRGAAIVVGGGVAGLAAAALWRGVGGASADGFEGVVLNATMAATLEAAAEALLPPAPPPTTPPLTTAPKTAETSALSPYRAVVEAIDAYLARAPQRLQDEVRLACRALDHGTLLTGRWTRFAALPVAERLATLADFADCDDERRDLASGVRNLVMLGYYQLPQTHRALGYHGPMVPAQPRPLRDVDAAMVAAAGVLPTFAAPGGQR